MVGSSGTTTDWFDQDTLGCAVAQGDAVTVNLAEDRSGAGDLGNEGGLTEPHLTDTLAKFGVAGQFADPAQGASRELAEREAGVGFG